MPQSWSPLTENWRKRLYFHRTAEMKPSHLMAGPFFKERTVNDLGRRFKARPPKREVRIPYMEKAFLSLKRHGIRFSPLLTPPPPSSFVMRPMRGSRSPCPPVKVFCGKCVAMARRCGIRDRGSLQCPAFDGM